MVANRVAIGVIDLLELVQVQKDQAQGSLFVQRGCHLARQHLVQQVAIGEAGQAVAGRHLLKLRLRFDPAQAHLNAGVQLSKPSWFHHIIVSAELQVADLTVRLPFGGQHDDVYWMEIRVGLEFPAKRRPIHTGHHQVCDDDVRVERLCHLQPLFAGQGLLHMIALLGQRILQQTHQVRVIIHNQDPGILEHATLHQSSTPHRFVMTQLCHERPASSSPIGR